MTRNVTGRTRRLVVDMDPFTIALRYLVAEVEALPYPFDPEQDRDGAAIYRVRRLQGLLELAEREKSRPNPSALHLELVGIAYVSALRGNLRRQGVQA